MARSPKRTNKIDLVATERLLSTAQAASDLKGEPVRLSEDDNGHRFLVYTTDHGTEARLRYAGDNFWLSINEMASLFERDASGIMRHIDNIIADGELSVEGNLQKMQVTPTGRPATLCSLDMVISVAYRVTNSRQATMLRMWATDKLVQILTKGFYIDKHSLKGLGEPDILDELRETAREIRASARNSYREVLRLCTFCSDYDGKSSSAREFFMDMENKLLWASAGMTGPQIILERCSSDKPELGLTYYAGKRGPTRRDVTVANNYLEVAEAQKKNRITEMWLTYVEDQLEHGRLPTMQAVRDKLVAFIRFNQWPLLSTRGRFSREDANRHALTQFAIFREIT